MPVSAPKPCRHSGCICLVHGAGGYCPEHEAELQRAADARRQSSSKRGYNSRWQRYRRAFLREHPLCVSCQAGGDLTPATVVDHIVPHCGDQKLFWDKSNHQPLCASCHGRKTASEDGGFGNPKRKQG